MKALTMTQIKNRLTESFENVSPLIRIDSKTAAIPGSRVSWHSSFEGLTLVVGCYPLGDDLETCDYQRFLYIPQTSDTFTF